MQFGVSETLNSQEGRFTVNIPPGYPVAQKTAPSGTSSVGNSGMTMYVSERSEGALAISFWDIPGVIAESEIEALLDKARDTQLRIVNSHLDKEEPYKVQGYPGRKIYFSGVKGDSAAYGQEIFCVVKNRFYVVIAENLSRDALTKPEIQSFFSLFKLTGEPER